MKYLVLLLIMTASCVIGPDHKLHPDPRLKPVGQCAEVFGAELLQQAVDELSVYSQPNEWIAYLTGLARGVIQDVRVLVTCLRMALEQPQPKARLVSDKEATKRAQALVALKWVEAHPKVLKVSNASTK